MIVVADTSPLNYLILIEQIELLEILYSRTQEQVAQAMGTTQAVVARLESGKVLPSTRTLERFASATRSRLRISFEPQQKAVR